MPARTAAPPSNLATGDVVPRYLPAEPSRSSNSASTNSSGSNSVRSSGFSPTPTYFTGRPTLLANGHHDAAFGRAVELGQHDAGALHRIGKVLRLADAVLARRGVEHQQHLVRRVGNLLADHAVNLGQLLHQVLLRLQSAGRVDDADVGPALDGRGHGPVGDAGRIAPLARP